MAVLLLAAEAAAVVAGGGIASIGFLSILHKLVAVTSILLAAIAAREATAT